MVFCALNTGSPLNVERHLSTKPLPSHISSYFTVGGEGVGLPAESSVVHIWIDFAKSGFVCQDVFQSNVLLHGV